MLQAIDLALNPARSSAKHWQALDALKQADITELNPNVKVEVERGHYLVKTVTCVRELEDVLRLRYRVFHSEYGIPEHPLQVDVDAYDFICDHLIVVDKRTQAIAGTYRLISSTFSNRFYSQEEFDLGHFAHASGIKLELGRACILPEYRTGSVLNLLWKGLMHYSREVEATWLFGCSSIRAMDPRTLAILLARLREAGHVSFDLDATPHRKYRLESLARAESELVAFPPSSEESEAARKLVPSLLQTYLRAGAKVCAEPALDRDFNCSDLLTVMKIDELRGDYEARFGKE